MDKQQFLVYGNSATKVAHRRYNAGDACRESAVKRENIEHFENFQQASSPRYGYRACKRCKPDEVK